MRSRSIADCTAGSRVGRAFPFPGEPMRITAAAALRTNCLPARALRMRANISAFMPKPTRPPAAGPSRREFIATGAIAAAAWMIVPRHVLGQGLTPPSDLVNIAIVGIGGMGAQQRAGRDEPEHRRDLRRGRRARRRADRRRGASRCSRRRRGRPARRRTGRPPAPAAADARRGRTSARPSCSSAAERAVAARRRQREPEALRRGADAAPEAPSRLPRDAGAAEGHRRASSSRRPITCTRRSRRRRWPRASTSTCRSRCAGRCRKRGTSRRRPPRNPKLVTQMGNQGHSTDDARRGQDYLAVGRRSATSRKCTCGRTARSATGRRAFRVRRSSTATGRRSAGATAASPGALANAFTNKVKSNVPKGLRWDLFLGAAPDVAYHPLYHPFNWRGWVDWGQGALGDMGAHLDRSSGVGLEARPADVDRDDLDAVQRRELSERDDDVLRVPGARRHAGREADVVRRRLHAAAAGRDGRREARGRGRRALHRDQGQDAAGQHRRASAAAAGGTAQQRSARRRSGCRACRTRRTK